MINLSEEFNEEEFNNLKSAFETKVAENAKKRQHMISRYKQDVNQTAYLNAKLNVLMDSILTEFQKLQVFMATENIMSDALDEAIQQLARNELLEGIRPV